MRVVIAEDMALLRDGLSRLLEDAGVEVVAGVDNVPELLQSVGREQPDVALIDIKLPPTWSDEGIQAAMAIRSRHRDTAVLLLSSYLDSRFAATLLEAHPESSGYLLKDQVSDPGMLLDAMHRVHTGECVVDPMVVERLMARKRVPGPLDRLTARQREVLALMAEGHSNQRIRSVLGLSARTVESHVRSVFTALTLPESPDESRRVLAVLTYLRG